MAFRIRQDLDTFDAQQLLIALGGRLSRAVVLMRPNRGLNCLSLHVVAYIFDCLVNRVLGHFSGVEFHKCAAVNQRNLYSLDARQSPHRPLDSADAIGTIHASNLELDNS